MSTTLKIEKTGTAVEGKYHSQSETWNWYVLDTRSTLAEDWRFIGSSIRYEYRGLSALDAQTNYLVTPVHDPRIPEIPQFYAPHTGSDEAAEADVRKFFEAYGQIVLTYIYIALDEREWAAKITESDMESEARNDA